MKVTILSPLEPEWATSKQLILIEDKELVTLLEPLNTSEMKVLVSSLGIHFALFRCFGGFGYGSNINELRHNIYVVKEVYPSTSHRQRAALKDGRHVHYKEYKEETSLTKTIDVLRTVISLSSNRYYTKSKSLVQFEDHVLSVLNSYLVSLLNQVN